jgi:hypothetical protein
MHLQLAPEVGLEPTTKRYKVDHRAVCRILRRGRHGRTSKVQLEAKEGQTPNSFSNVDDAGELTTILSVGFYYKMQRVVSGLSLR